MLLGFQPLYGGRGSFFSANAIVTAPVIWSTAAGTGGPLLYNGSASGHSGVTAYLMAISYGLSVASAVAGAIGIATGATTAPTSTSAVTASGNLTLNGPAPICSVYSVGTVSAAATNFLPTGHIHTGAITLDTDDDNFVHLGGVIAIPPGYFASVSTSETLTTAVISIGLVWLEVPND